MLILAFLMGVLVAFILTWFWCESRLSRAKVLHATLTERLEQERRAHEEKMNLLMQAKENLRQEFENLAHRIFEEKQQAFHQQSGQRLDHLISPLREQLSHFHKKVEDVYEKESRERNSLIGEIKTLKDLNQRMSQDALNLAQALKGDNKAQGNWGEMVLEKILERSGLLKGREYETQVSLRDDEGRRRSPDVIIRLPEGKDIIIDSKMTLVDYDRYCAATLDDEKKAALKAHALAIRNHIQNLGSKAYDNLEGIRTLDFVLMFIPVEAAFMIAVESDPEIFREAFDKGIVVVSPTTLLATLRTVQSIWRYEKQNRNAEVIAIEAGRLHDQFIQLLESIEVVGSHLDKAKDAYDISIKRISYGRGNLVSKVQQLEKLGAKTKKTLPNSFISDNEESDTGIQD